MGKLKYVDIKSSASEFLALTSLTVEEFEILVPHFEKAFQELCQNGVWTASYVRSDAIQPMRLVDWQPPKSASYL